jgi:release factor glutamine methyltransferase
MATIGTLLEDAEERILDSPHVDLWRSYVARLDAEELMREVLGRDFDKSDHRYKLDGAVRRRFKKMVKRRISGEPVALIRGHVDFMGMDLEVRHGVFTPRFSSELLAQEAIRRLRPRRQPIHVDAACGGGAVALGVARKLRHAHVYGLDIAPAAVALGRRNAKRLGLPNAKFLAGDLLEPLPRQLRGKVGVITIHPPYVARSQVRTLPREIRDYEPPESLTDRSVDGLGLVRRLAAEGWDWLEPGGWLVIEVAPDLARSVRSVLLREGYLRVKSNKDAVGATRVVVGSTA